MQLSHSSSSISVRSSNDTYGISSFLSIEFNTELVDLRKVFKNYISENNPENKAKGILTSDGVHLNNQGSRLIAENMLNYIR